MKLITHNVMWPTLFKSSRKKVQITQKAGGMLADLMSALLGIEVCAWFLKALVSSVKGQAVTVQPCHFHPLSNPSSPIICPSPSSLLLPGAEGSDERLYRPGRTSVFTCALTRSGTHTSCSPPLNSHSERVRKQIHWEWNGWMDR